MVSQLRARKVESVFELDEVSFSRIAKLVHKMSGIVLTENKRSLMVSRLSRRLRIHELSDFSDYCDLLENEGSKEERAEMLYTMTTNVTRFFREPHHFEYVHSEIHNISVCMSSAGRKEIKVWSAGCSTGEEPYSIAMLLTYLSENRAYDLNFRLLATDIDRRVIEKAKSAIYEKKDESHPYEKIFERYTHEIDRNHVGISDKIKSKVSFAELNLLGNWPMAGPFDLIFCRNVVIYFDAQTQERLWRRFSEILSPGGIIAIGHSERVVGLAESNLRPCGITIYKKSK